MRRNRYASTIALTVGCVLWTASAGEAHAAPAARTAFDSFGHLHAVDAPAGRGFRYLRVEGGVQFQLDGITKTLVFYSPTVVRVNANRGESYWKHPSIVVVRKPEAVPFEVRDAGDRLDIVGRQTRVAIDKRTGALTFSDGAGRVLVREKSDAPQSVQSRTVANAPTYEVENRFTLKPGEGIYGFGFTADEEVNRRNKKLLLVQTNVGTIIPVMMSSEGYGILWDTYSMMRFEDDRGGARLWAEDAPGGATTMS